MFENHGVSRKPEWITNTRILVEACPGDAKCRPTGRSVLLCRVERISESISQASSCLSDVNLVAGTTFDKVYHVVACTGVLGIDGDMSPRSVDRR